MSKYIDITLPISDELTNWPGDPPLTLEKLQCIQRGDNCNVTAMSSTVHFGTHIDAPFHFLDDGMTVEQLSLDLLIGDVYVLDIGYTLRNIIVEDISDVPEGCKRLLFRTGNSRLGYLGDSIFHADYFGLTAEASRELVKRGIFLIGLDYYSIGCFKEIETVHRIFLSQPGSIALEAVDLRNVTQGWYRLLCLPLRIGGSDGAPCRCILEKKDEGKSK